MKAAAFRAYGGPEVLEIIDIDTPRPGPGEVLVEVYAASVNPVDWKMRQGLLKEHFPVSFPRIVGRDMAGVVAGLGEGVSGLKIGDRVYALGAATKQGTLAEFMTIDAGLVRAMPAKLDFISAAALPLAFMTAWISLVSTGELKRGERVLIHAAAGGVGSIAVQIAKHVGATVIATCSARNLDYVRALGADEAIDYRATDFADIVRDVDMVYDTVGADVYDRSFKTLKPGGRLVWIRATPPQGEARRADVAVKLATVKPDPGLLDTLRELVEAGAIKAQVGTVLPLSEAAKALRLSQEGHARGKIIVKVR
ncbi:MAG TPA: NADP-dependent oxidoreductase [Alphaproteobacteria bacterium]|jgi:NADPH:quinone reductase-like Zn-dependent oxidoreductase